MGGVPAPAVAVAPKAAASWLREAVVAGGGELVDLADAEALVWADPADPDGLGRVLAANPGLEWVQLPWAGVEPYVAVIRSHADRTWTCGKGVYAEPVAELALTLLLAGKRGLATYARASSWAPPRGDNLLGASVVVLGGGGITESFLRLLGPFGCRTTVVRRQGGSSMVGADAVVGMDGIDGALDGADAVVLALALTPETEGVLDARRLGLLAPGAWVVNVARGRHVVTDDLVAALAGGRLGGAGLDVTDPEPLPDDHPLWALPNVLVTPHIGNTPAMAVPLLSARVTDNVRRWLAGEELLGPVDPEAGY